VARDKDVPAPAKAAKASMDVVWGIAAYAFCSASLLVINKVAVSAIPSASFVLICQFAASVAAVLGLSALGMLEKVVMGICLLRPWSRFFKCSRLCWCHL